MVGESRNGIYAFDRFTLDTGTLMLYRDGSEITIPPKMVKTLAVLVQAGGAILSKDDLIQLVWDDAIVEESNLSQYIYKLRKTLGDRPDGEPYIQTLRRRGYRFNGELRLVEPVIDPVPARRPQAATTPRVTVTQHGNVLRLADWQKRETSPPALHEVREQRPGKSTRGSRYIILAGALIVLLILAGIILQYREASTRSEVRSRPEISMLRLTSGLKPAGATISYDGNYFVYHEIEGDICRMWVQQVGQTNRVEIAASPEYTYEAKTFSPDAKFIYFIGVAKETGLRTLFKIATMGGPVTRLLDNVGSSVSFSPNGEQLVFVRVEQAGGTSGLVISDRNGENGRDLLTRHPPIQLTGSPAWSPDGRSIAFAEDDQSGSHSYGSKRIYSVDVATGAVRLVSTEAWDIVYRKAWMGDGSGLVMIATRANDAYSTRRDQVYFLSLRDGSSTRLTTDGSRHDGQSLGVTKDAAVIATPYNRAAQIWRLSPGGDPASGLQISKGQADGRAGLVALPDGRVGYIGRSGDDLHIWLMNADGSNPQRLSRDSPITDELRADPSGHFLVFSSVREQHSRLFRIDTDGREIKQLTSGEGHEIDSTVSADGTQIVYGSFLTKGLGGQSFLWKISSAGGDPQRFGNGECWSPLYSPDGSLISCVQKGQDVLILSSDDGRELERHKLPAHSFSHFGVGWTPDGKELLFILSEKGSSNVWAMSRNDGSKRRVTHFTNGEVHRYAYSTDGQTLFVSHGQQVQDAILISNFH